MRVHTRLCTQGPSSSFRACSFRQAMRGAKPLLLEPVMATEVAVPSEFQGAREPCRCLLNSLVLSVMPERRCCAAC